LNQRDELLAYLLEREGFERQSEYTIPRRDNDDAPPPLSFAQERFWFLDQFEHARPVYNGCKVERLVGELRLEVLLECLNLIVRRHEVLRTSYPAPDGRPIQCIAASCSIEITVTDLEHVADTELLAAIELLIRNEWLQPIDLSEGLPIRARLARIDHAQHLLILTLHQIVFDSRSVAIFFRELWIAYEAILNGKEPQLAALPVQYADFASWQRYRVSGQAFQTHREYWIQRLSGTLPVLNLPTDKPRPPVQAFDGSRLSVQLPETLQLKLKELSRENDVTLFVTLLAAFKTLLYRYTAQEDLLVGCPVLNRRLPETENLLGSFVNTLVLRTSYSGIPSFRETLRRVRETCVGAFAHQDFPFEKLVEELQPQRDLARNPIFQVMFAFQNTSVPALELAGLRSEPVDIDAGMTKFDLTFSLIDKKHGIVGHIEYSTDLFHRDTIKRMAGHFETLLEGIVADPDQPISTLPILTESEGHQILVEWNDTAADYPKDQCIHELFEAQVERTPDAIALEFEGSEISYRELNRRANQLAHYLISLGIGPANLVGICVERSIEMVVGLMGILKAGGAYVPLDPSYPRERLGFMLEDSQVSVLLTQEKLVEGREWKPVLSPSAALRINSVEGMEDGDPRSSVLDPRLTVVCLDRDLPLIAQKRDNNPKSGTESNNLAYVIYTSGSTGRPKGVQIEHRSVVNCLSSIGRAIELSQQDAWLAITTISFDIAALELYLPLIRGAKLTLASKDESSDSGQLLARMKASRSTVIQATPSLWKMLLENDLENKHKFKILCGGEALSTQLADELLDRGSSVWNLYGPTEATIWSTMAKVETNDKPVPIGRPIANTQIYILDTYLQPVPIGIPGDLYIGGDGLAMGYLNRPELTSEKFIPNPFSDNSNSRLYRTGDRAKYLADGNIEFLGRIDDQIKIRGHRIELGEIEATLIQHPAVKDSVLVSRARDSLAEESLVAYVVQKQQPAPSVTELCNYLKEKLPEYMIPSMFVMLESLPLTANGKVDRNALPPPDGERPLLDQSLVEPRTEIEELVAQVWREVLKLDKLGVHDNFFDLGGHSLLATRVIARLRNNYSVDIALRKLFELPTVAGLARHVDLLKRSDSGVAIAPIVPVSRNQSVPLSFSQRRLWYLQKVDAQLSAYNIPAMFRIEGDLVRAALEQALNAMIARHEVLRSYVKELAGRPYQEFVPTLQISMPFVDLTEMTLDQAKAEAERLAIEDACVIYDLKRYPLFRAKLVKLADADHLFILNFHHIIADGSSLAIFYRELAVLYDGLRNGKTPLLAELPIQYADYAAWQHEWLRSAAFDAQLSYWKRQLASLPAPDAFPTDFERSVAQTYRGARTTRQLSGDLTSALKNLGRQQSVTVFMTLFAAFSILLSRISGQDDIVIGSTIAGRNRPEIDGLIGFFINALPLRTDLSGNPSFLTLLQRVRGLCIDAYTNQDVPFEKIVEEIKPRREPGRNPIFDILFNIADTSERILTLAGCGVTKLAQIDPEAKFDIVLHAPEVGGKIELAIVYNTVLFREDRITLLLEQWAALLDQVASHPELPISQLSLVTDISRTVLPDPKEVLDDMWEGAIHELFSQRARITPEKLAVIDSDNTWTYQELDQRSARLANYLLANGIRPKDIVAIYAHRSPSLVLALLGVLKAGAAFFILDPAYPPARLTSYLRIARPKGWIQMGGAGELGEELANCLETLDLTCRVKLPVGKQMVADVLSQQPQIATEVITSTSDPAYIAFTSGSTGEPKGVVCRHGPITHFLPWQKEAFNLHEMDRFCLLSGLAYNHLHRDVFTPLALGATLYVPPAEIVREPTRLTEWLRANAISVLHLTPALGQLLLTAGAQPLPEVRRVLFGGDVLTTGLVAEIRRVLPNAMIGVFYGATETQRAVGYYEIPASFETNRGNANRPIPLGRGIKDVQLLLLNRAEQLAGVGELGELYVRSPHLAEGYIGDGKLTKEKFITNPFTDDPKDRLYRTGEMGQYLPDGAVEWAGRNDRCVNIHGFRVELEEVESVLQQHPAVREAAVILQNYEMPNLENSRPETRDPRLASRLVAYIVGGEEASQSLTNLLHGYLSTRLPDYMVPAHFVLLEQLPLSPNGKVDYRSLPPVQEFLSSSSKPIAPPRNEVEAKISAIFSQVLGREQVGIEENFFRIGGHSLLAVQAAARIREAFGVSLELRTFLESPTVAGLAKEIEVRLRADKTALITDGSDREEIEL
jgi:amino acid adenylation domain-containing protein